MHIDQKNPLTINANRFSCKTKQNVLLLFLCVFQSSLPN